jgi:hypothetical protein
MIWNSQKHLYEKIKILFYALLKIFVLYFKKEKNENILVCYAIAMPSPL